MSSSIAVGATSGSVGGDNTPRSPRPARRAPAPDAEGTPVHHRTSCHNRTFGASSSPPFGPPAHGRHFRSTGRLHPTTVLTSSCGSRIFGHVFGCRSWRISRSHPSRLLTPRVQGILGAVELYCLAFPQFVEGDAPQARVMEVHVPSSCIVIRNPNEAEATVPKKINNPASFHPLTLVMTPDVQMADARSRRSGWCGDCHPFSDSLPSGCSGPRHLYIPTQPDWVRKLALQPVHRLPQPIGGCYR